MKSRRWSYPKSRVSVYHVQYFAVVAMVVFVGLVLMLAVSP